MSVKGSADGTLALSLQGRQPDDAVVEEAGARVYLQQEAADIVEDSELDAQVDDQGRVSFVFGSQPS
jgi:iron-sulfur cluster assembly protein